MEPHEQCWVRLPLDGAINVRELGGYPIPNDGQTRFHRFLRGDCLGRLSRRDERFLRDYGVSAIVDLRDPSEVHDCPDKRIGPNVVYTNIALLDVNLADVEEVERTFYAPGFSMKTMYGEMIENYEAVRDCFRFIAEAPDGCVLFHCAVGKDRTGVLAMLLLSLAGVDKWDIVANYVQTQHNLMRDDAYVADWLDPANRGFRPAMESAADVIEHAYDLVENDHGGVENYLLECGVPDEEVAAVWRRLVS